MASGLFKHLTGRDRAEQVFAGVTLIEHPVRSDFVDDANLVDTSDFVDSGLPVTENASDDEKTASEAL